MSVVSMDAFRRKKESEAFKNAPDLENSFNAADRALAEEVREGLMKGPDCLLTRMMAQQHETQRVLNANGMHMPRQKFSSEDLDAMDI